MLLALNGYIQMYRDVRPLTIISKLPIKICLEIADLHFLIIAVKKREYIKKGTTNLYENFCTNNLLIIPRHHQIIQSLNSVLNSNS